MIEEWKAPIVQELAAESTGLQSFEKALSEGRTAGIVMCLQNINVNILSKWPSCLSYTQNQPLELIEPEHNHISNTKIIMKNNCK
jgi:hypothetical protein